MSSEFLSQLVFINISDIYISDLSSLVSTVRIPGQYHRVSGLLWI